MSVRRGVGTVKGVGDDIIVEDRALLQGSDEICGDVIFSVVCDIVILSQCKIGSPMFSNSLSLYDLLRLRQSLITLSVERIKTTCG